MPQPFLANKNFWPLICMTRFFQVQNYTLLIWIDLTSQVHPLIIAIKLSSLFECRHSSIASSRQSPDLARFHYYTDRIPIDTQRRNHLICATHPKGAKRQRYSHHRWDQKRQWSAGKAARSPSTARVLLWMLAIPIATITTANSSSSTSAGIAFEVQVIVAAAVSCVRKFAAFIADDNEQRDNCDSTDKVHLIIAVTVRERGQRCYDHCCCCCCWSVAIDTAQQSANRWQVDWQKTEWMNEWLNDWMAMDTSVLSISRSSNGNGRGHL